MTTEAPPETPTTPPADPPVEPPAGAAPRPRRRPRKRYVIAAAVLTVLTAAGVTTGVLVDKYAYPPTMSTYYYGWASGEIGQRDSQAGSWSQSAVLAAPGHTTHTFYIGVVNSTRVAQTIVGIQPGFGDTSENPELGVSAADSELSGDPESVRYVPGGVTIPPGGSRLLRWTFHSPACIGDGQTWREDLPLRIRTGWITRSRDFPLGNKVAMAVYGTKPC